MRVRARASCTGRGGGAKTWLLELDVDKHQSSGLCLVREYVWCRDKKKNNTTLGTIWLVIYSIGPVSDYSLTVAPPDGELTS